MPITTLGLGHAVLEVRRLDRSLPFYTEGLGLREVARHDFGEGPMAFLSTGRTHHDLALVEIGDRDAAAAPEAPGLHHLAFCIGSEIGELRGARDHLGRLGIAVEMVLDHGVSQGLYIIDPDGHLIELYVDGDPAIWHADPSAVASSRPLRL